MSWHQDATYFALEPVCHVTAWVALTDASVEAGCMEVVPGSHKLGQLRHADMQDPENLLSRGQTLAVDVDRSRTEFMPVKAGSSRCTTRTWCTIRGPTARTTGASGSASATSRPMRAARRRTSHAMLVRGQRQLRTFRRRAPADRGGGARGARLPCQGRRGLPRHERRASRSQDDDPRLRLPYHDRYAYSPITERKDYSWPGGKRLAVYLGLNIEHSPTARARAICSPSPTRRPTRAPSPGATTATGSACGAASNVRRAQPAGRAPDQHHGVRLCAADRRRAESARRRFVGHGRTNAERHGGMWEADEKRFLEEVRDAIEKASGKRPRGWMAPWMASTRWTPDLLKEVGFDFLMDWPNDDQPIWMKTRSGPLMSVPYPIEVNDSPQIRCATITGDDFRDIIIGQFEELLRQSAKQPLVCGIALHTMIVGQPYRLQALREALQHIANHPQKDKVWFTRPSGIYDHCAALPKGRWCRLQPDNEKRLS